MLAIHSIVHPTDFSDASADAFAHALRIALTAKAKLYILHVAMSPADEDWMSFPHVRETLARWASSMRVSRPPRFTANSASRSGRSN